MLSKGHNLRFAQFGKLAGSRNGSRRNTEQRHKDTLLGAVVLIGCIPDRPPGAQQLEHATHIITLDRQRIDVMPLSAATLDKIEQRVLVLAVHAVDGVLLAEQGGTDFQGGEVERHQDHALAFELRLLEVLQPFDMGQFGQTRF